MYVGGGCVVVSQACTPGVLRGQVPLNFNDTFDTFARENQGKVLYNHHKTELYKRMKKYKYSIYVVFSMFGQAA